jgi:uncharacterized repeat protein (TIGR01451 family)
MKKNYPAKFIIAVIFIVCASNYVQAQMVYMPDTNFQNALSNFGLGSCIIGDSIDSSCPAVLSTQWLDLGGANIYDLQGIQAFINLQVLNCDGDSLTSLPDLPGSLLTLSLYNGQLTSLPVLPPSLTYLDCSYNHLTTIPELPDSLNQFNCNNNPNLSCLPQLKRIVNFNFSGTSVTCLPNYGQVTNSIPPLNSLPLCGLFNSNGCTSFSDISGKTYFDSNTNCSFDSSDYAQQNMHIMLYRNGSMIQQTYTGGEALYSFDLHDSSGVFVVQLDTTSSSFSVLCPSSIQYNDTVTATDSVFYHNDFALKCRSGFDIGALSILGFPFRPAHYTAVHIQAGDIANFYGVHCATGISGTVTVSFTGSVNYVSPAAGALTPDNVSGNTITYTIPDFGTVDFFHSFNIIVQTDTLAAIGSQVCFTVGVSLLAGDNDSTNNILTHCFTIVGSIDPNEKEVDPINTIDLTGNKWLTYTINFQNTGTAAAEHIYIDDTLNTNLDLSTFQLLAYSHQPLVQILEGGIARFNFPNINLPDSNANEPASHGYVQYKIKLKDNSTVGTQINNTGYIYFDFNSPVVTNTTVNTVANSVGITSINNDLQISVFPNPTRDEFTVYCPQFTVGKKINLTLTDILGKELLFQTMRSANCRMSTANFPSGIYFLHIETEDGVVVKKLVKE